MSKYENSKRELDTLKVSIVQTHLHWEDVDANLAHFTVLLDEATPADIFVLPEMFTTGFSMNPEKLAAESFFKGLAWMQQTAARKNAAITGSMMAEANGRYYNRLVFARPDGTVDFYDKKHLFNISSEQLHYTPGTKKLVTHYKDWKICPLICYDLRFPVWSRNVEDYDLLLYVANWPAKRSYQWKSLLIARAIENQCYVAGCNRTGTDGNNLEYNGTSLVADYAGQVLDVQVDVAATFSATFSKDALKKYRDSFPFLADRDTFQLL